MVDILHIRLVGSGMNCLVGTQDSRNRRIRFDSSWIPKGNGNRLQRKFGFTLVELLVVVSVIGTLVLLLLPAIQAAREAARRVNCKNNLKQIGMAMLSHHDSQEHFPTGGWGARWTGVPGQGYREEQPGGWIYNSLSYMEQGPLRELGGGGSLVEVLAAGKQRLQTPLPIFNCRSRRSANVYPTTTKRDFLQNPCGSETVLSVARSDYAANSGATASHSIGPACSDRLNRDEKPFLFLDKKVFSGISFPGSAVQIKDITDGTSATLLVGEKRVDADSYKLGTDSGDDQSMQSGFSSDVNRFTTEERGPAADSEDLSHHLRTLRFGSAHVDSCHFVYCDGSVRTISYGIDGKAFSLLGNRHDGAMIE